MSLPGYTPTAWSDSPSTSTPVDAANLDNLEAGDSIDRQALIELTTGALGSLVIKPGKLPAIPGTISTVNATVTTGVTLVAGTENPTDATAGTVAHTLPSATGNAGVLVNISKVDSSINTVTFTGNIRGSTMTGTLSLQYEAIELVSKGDGSWWPLRDHKTLTTLDARYSTNGVAATNYTTLIQFYAALANRENARCDIVYLGDSLPEGFPATSWERTITGWMTQLMRQRFLLPSNPIPSMSAIGNARGFVGIPCAALQAEGINNPFSMWSFTGGTQDDANGWGAKFSARLLGSSGAKADFTVVNGGITSFDINHTTSAAGSTTGGYYKIGAGSNVVFSTHSSSTTAAVLNVAGAVSGGTVIEVGWNNGAGVELTGITEYGNTEAAGVTVHNCGVGGAKASTWAGTHPSGGWPQAMANLLPDLIVIALGGNEYLNAIASSTYKTNMLALIAIIRAAGMSCPIVLSLPYNGPPIVGGGEPLSAYVARAKEMAAADPTLLVLDNSVRMPATNATNTYNLYYSDGIHGNANGNAYALMSETLAATISPQ